MTKLFMLLITAGILIAPTVFAQSNCDSLFSLADKTYRQQGANAAILVYNQIIAANCAKLGMAYGNRGFLYNDLQLYAAALLDFEKALQLDPNNSAVYANECTAYNFMGNHAAARFQIEKAIKLSPKYYAYYKLRGDIKYTEEKYDSAIMDYKHSLALNSNDLGLYTHISEIYEDDIHGAGHLDSAAAVLTRLIENNPSNHVLIFKRAEFYLRNGATDAAIVDFKEGMKTDSTDFEYVCDFGLCYDNNSDWENAIRFYTKSINIKKNTLAYVNRGRVYKKTNKIELAMADEQIAIAIDPSFAQAYLILGNCYLLKHDTANAAANYKKGLAQKPKGQIETLLKRQLSTIEPTIVVQNFNDSASYYMGLADEYFKAAFYDTAFTMFKAAARLSPKNAEAYFKMGRCKWLARLKIMQADNVDDFATDTAMISHLYAEIMFYYDKAIYLDSIENGEMYAKRVMNSLEAIKDMHTNYQYYFFRGILKGNFREYAGALADYEKSILIHPTIDAYNYAAGLAKLVGLKEKACEYKQWWATMMNPSEDISVFEKHEIADKFCKELGVKQK